VNFILQSIITARISNKQELKTFHYKFRDSLFDGDTVLPRWAVRRRIQRADYPRIETGGFDNDIDGFFQIWQSLYDMVSEMQQD